MAEELCVYCANLIPVS